MSKKHIVIAGGSSGIGWALTRQLVEEGHSVTVLSRNDLPDQTMPSVSHITGDVLKDDLNNLAWPEQVDSIVYCPGSITLKPFRSLDPEQFSLDLEINLLGAVRLIRALLTKLKKSKNDPSIVMFSTVAANVGLPFHTSIAAAKGAVQSFAVSLAAELSPSIRVNCVAPSLTDTPLAKDLLSDERKREASDKRHPLKRVGKAEDQAAMAAFLVSDKSSWITGQIFQVDGGLSRLKT